MTATSLLVPTVTTLIHDGLHAAVTSVASGTPVHDSVTVAGGAGAPTAAGTVTIEWFTKGTCKGRAAASSPALVLVNGAVDAAGFVQTPLAAGLYAFRATYSGDATFASQVGACEVLTVP